MKLHRSIDPKQRFMVRISYRYGRQLTWSAPDTAKTISGSTLRKWIRGYVRHAENKGGYFIDHSDYYDGSTPKPWMQFEYYHNGLLNEIKVEWDKELPPIMPDWVGPPIKKSERRLFI